MVKRNITVEELHEALNYDPDTGIFVWKTRKEVRQETNTMCAGKIAGGNSASHGYIDIGINNRRYLGHRLAWFYVHGIWPPCQIDHINMIRTDNRITNLRLANHSENKWNRGKTSKNTSGYKGVRLHKHSGLWQVRISRNKKEISLGYFKTIEEAAAKYAEYISNMKDGFSRC